MPGPAASRRRDPGWVAGMLVLALSLFSGGQVLGKTKTRQPVVRWAEGQPGCTFARGDDGKYRWGLWSNDFGVTLAVDSQELQQTRHRIGHLLGVELTYRYRGSGSLEVRNDNLSLQFVRHRQVVHTSLDPNNLTGRLQSDADELSHQTEREIRKHPEKKDELQTKLEHFEKETAEWQEFLSAHSLLPVKLDQAKPEADGWVFFSAQDKWIGDWKNPEEFVLRIPLDDRVLEFPFKLPPSQGDLILRKRP
jgi:FtsZ-binding cell division protein ZapB